jgi:A/G-specific adenine glycosylase
MPWQNRTVKNRTVKMRQARLSSSAAPPLTAFTDGSHGAFRRAMKSWYRRHARPLPWRQMADPYPIWISEIMLQQTTVVAVIPYFQRFLARFPTVRQLAAADEEEVLRLWEGLGYYSRARNIHRTARLIAGAHNGVFPDSVAALQELPGIGRYTAGAIVSFAFDRPAPIVEANTLRLYSRLLGFRGDPRSVDGQKLLWNFAETILPARSPGQFNQALMELGATVCTPEKPVCECCPVSRWCAAFAEGTQTEIPQNARRPAITAVTEIAVAIERDGKYLLLKRPEGERWGGLWDFVRFPEEDNHPSRQHAENNGKPRAQNVKARARGRSGSQATGPALARRIADAAGVNAQVGALLAELRHSVTRFRITLYCYHARWLAGEPVAAETEYRWIAPGRLGELPLSTTGRKLARLLEQTL